MTAEVAVMNQQAIVLAADSATTVTVWGQGEPRIRYFKGVNKLFQLSTVHPIALMIYGSSSLHQVPWELVIKDFRRALGSDYCDELPEYANRFFAFIDAHTEFFPNGLRQTLFIEEVIQAAVRHYRDLSEKSEIRDAEGKEKGKALGCLLEAVAKKLRLETPEAPVSKADVHTALSAHLSDLIDEILERRAEFPLLDHRLTELLAQVTILDVMINFKTYLCRTGIIVAGYGDRDYFPSCEAYICYGFLDRRLIYNRNGEPTRIGEGLSASIKAFATASMIDSFRAGIAPDLFVSVVRATQKELRSFAERLRASLAPGVPFPGNLDEMIHEATISHREEWLRQSNEEHYRPLIAALASLPVSEMVALARSLIELQSLKERLTKSTESVAGPVDVAVITKHEGFVWIDRKHYFKPELNPRFFDRQRVGSVQ